ncbi:MAG: phosphoesterase, partial [Actinobacteria bacterium]|nr:phosphoesterase [Actinomycetota bacterium]
MSSWGSLRKVDQAGFRRVASTDHSPVGDRVLWWVSRAGDWSVVWVVTALLLAMFGGRRGRRAALRGWLAIAISSGVFNHSIKLLVRRARPDLELVPSHRHPVK